MKQKGIHDSLQPPSGGCVLKHLSLFEVCAPNAAAAFGRLCVETWAHINRTTPKRAAAFGRLCVETKEVANITNQNIAAAFGRLCVETKDLKELGNNLKAAAFGRLCVETMLDDIFETNHRRQPPSGGCVLKLYRLRCPKSPTLQPPSGGCVLKLKKSIAGATGIRQPPSGGCVLKQILACPFRPKSSSRLRAAVC